MPFALSRRLVVSRMTLLFGQLIFCGQLRSLLYFLGQPRGSCLVVIICVAYAF